MAEGTTVPSNVKLLYANGINAVTGDYALPPMTAEDLKKGITGGFTDPEAKALKNWRAAKRGPNYATREGVDARKLDQAGWGILFPAKTDPAIIDALRPLMDWRKQQAGDLYHEYLDAKGAVRPMNVDDKGKWLARQGAENYGPVDPAKVPYYLAIVGDPSQIDYRFQYLLDVQYGVGRICFDTPEEYAQYAQSVVEAEKQQIQRSRQLTFFGVANDGDVATNLSDRYLIDPLSKYTTGLQLKAAAGWNVQTISGEAATKERLDSLLRGSETPGLIFTASHGLDFPMTDPKLQRARQGALLCQNWPGRAAWGNKEIPEDFYFWEKDLAGDANLWGAIAFLFACYGAGTPQYDEFYKAAFKDRAKIAEKSFIARLPQRMMSHPKGGALAVIGHVERAWGYSFAVDESPSLEAFRSALHAMMDGAPVGLAFEYFNERFAEFTTSLTDKIQSDEWDPVDPLEIANTWTATNDAKNYVVLGDPAVRVRVCDQPGEQPAAVQPIVLNTVPAKAGANGGQIPVAADTTGPVEVPVEPASQPAVKPVEVPVEKGPMITPAQPVNYGLGEDLAQVKNSLAQFTQKLSDFLGEAIKNAATLEVTTYTSADVSTVKVTGGQISGANTRAVTLLRIDGDIESVIPLNEDGLPDTALWNLHVEMVKQAQASRSELLKAAVSAVTSLVNLGAPK